MTVWTCAVTTRALRGKEFFCCRPLVLDFHTYLTLDFATRKPYPCGTISAFFQVVSVATYPSVFQSA